MKKRKRPITPATPPVSTPVNAQYGEIVIRLRNLPMADLTRLEEQTIAANADLCAILHRYFFDLTASIRKDSGIRISMTGRPQRT